MPRVNRRQIWNRQKSEISVLSVRILTVLPKLNLRSSKGKRFFFSDWFANDKDKINFLRVFLSFFFFSPRKIKWEKHSLLVYPKKNFKTAQFWIYLCPSDNGEYRWCPIEAAWLTTQTWIVMWARSMFMIRPCLTCQPLMLCINKLY